MVLDTSYLFPRTYFKKRFDQSLSQKLSLLSPIKRMVFTRSVFLWFSPLLPVFRGGHFHHRVYRWCVIFMRQRVAYRHLPPPCLLPAFCSKFIFIVFLQLGFFFFGVLFVLFGFLMVGSCLVLGNIFLATIA